MDFFPLFTYIFSIRNDNASPLAIIDKKTSISICNFNLYFERARLFKLDVKILIWILSRKLHAYKPCCKSLYLGVTLWNWKNLDFFQMHANNIMHRKTHTQLKHFQHYYSTAIITLSCSTFSQLLATFCHAYISGTRIQLQLDFWKILSNDEKKVPRRIERRLFWLPQKWKDFSRKKKSSILTSSE